MQGRAVRRVVDGWRQRWTGATAVCLASGPSLCAEDVETVRLWRGDGRVALVANTTFRVAPWADALFAHDYRWWKHYHEEVHQHFQGGRLAVNGVQPEWGVTRLDRRRFNPFTNSGAALISLAAYTGCTRAVLLGYDCARGPNGETHHHGDHPKGMSSASSIASWPRLFERVAAHAASQGLEVVNCSRSTALTCFPRADLAL